MTKTTKLTVTTDVGTFTRTTARTYTHIVLVKDERKEVLEKERGDWLIYHRKAQRADGAEYAAYHAGEIAKLEKDGAIVVDKRTDWGVLGWAGRLDLARNVARSQQAMRYRHVRIYDIVTGQEVR